MYANQLFFQQPFAPGMGAEYTMITNTIEDAEDGFVDAKERLLDVNNWKRYCRVTGAEFTLKDNHGRAVHRRAHKGDHINMEIPGLEHHCAVIEALEYDDYPDLDMEAFTMRIKPCMHAGHANEYEEDERTPEGALVVERRGNHLYAAFHRRNSMDITATDNTFGLTDDQWSALLKRFIE